ncbi:MAG: BatD family protein [Capnocytophaga sp.]|nr:BatD family protein [Capnocytophaga sp.]
MNKRILFFLFFAISLNISAQQPKIQAKIDRKEIKIGEQIKYEISVEADSTLVISFPKGENFTPLEMVNSEPIDTFRQQEKFRLIKNYYLTQFDSGAYTIPRQAVNIGKNNFLTDSLQIKVLDVAVDTLKQPLFPIKPAINIQKPEKSYFMICFFVGLGVLFLISLALLLYFLVFRKKKLTEEEQIALLPPFDRAILGLKNLQNSKYLLESKQKEYYSELTDIIRKYLEEEVHISATESTTDELLQKIQTFLDAGRLHLSVETLKDLKNVLQKADLVKFAKSQPQDFEAENDRATIENIVIKTKEALPEPSEEDKMKDEYYRQMLEKQRRKRRKNNIIIASIISVVLLAMAGSGWYWYQSIAKKIKINTDNWITSTYGFPPVSITTPEVLKREKTKNLISNQSFIAQNEKKHLFTLLTTGTLEQPKEENEQINMEELVLNLLEIELKTRFKAENILTKYDPYQTPQGIVGHKVFGGFTDKNNENQIKKIGYQYYFFMKEGRLCALLFCYPQEETLYENVLIEKIMSSLNIK